jgi:hypothetical protein
MLLTMDSHYASYMYANIVKGNKGLDLAPFFTAHIILAYEMLEVKKVNLHLYSSESK